MATENVIKSMGCEYCVIHLTLKVRIVFLFTAEVSGTNVCVNGLTYTPLLFHLRL